MGANGVHALDWVMRNWQEMLLFSFPALLQHFITKLGPEARRNLDAGEPYGTYVLDARDAYVTDVIEKLLLESKVAALQAEPPPEYDLKAAPRPATPSAQTDGQGSPQARWEAAAETPRSPTVSPPAPKTDGQTPPMAAGKGRLKERMNIAINRVAIEVDRRKDSGERKKSAGAEADYVLKWYQTVTPSLEHQPSKRTLLRHQDKWYR